MPRAPIPDVVIVGDGIIALTIAATLVHRGGPASIHVLGATRQGIASTAAAGLLSPSVASVSPAVGRFLLASRDEYPAFVQWVNEASGAKVRLGPQGILEVARSAQAWESFRTSDRSATAPGSFALDQRILVDMEPALAPVAGALFHPRDNVVHPGELLEALRALLGASSRVELVGAEVVGIELGEGGNPPAARTAAGDRHQAGTIVLAAGAWAGRIQGLPRRIAVEPLRGQILLLGGVTPSPFPSGATLSHVVMDGHGYLVPRGNATLVGSTMEQAGFDAHTTKEALDGLHAFAAALCPSLARAPRIESWAGLRPATPDLLPILGADPDHPELLYACGHSRNGILMAPLTGECIASLIMGAPQAQDISAFSVARFGPS